ncbi:MAG: choice-of-anchor B family protein, partial [Longimicrobiales bacterium]|nr:choice-of-anchor B family protein [Longimicrobiales bacterium]
MRSLPVSPAAPLLFVLLAAFGTTVPAAAQDRFGAAVAVTERGEPVVLKPGIAVGPASATVYAPDPSGSWAPVARLGKLPGGLPGEAMLPAAHTGGGLLLLGSGDPAGDEAGHLYRREGDGWTAVDRVRMDPTTVSPTDPVAGRRLDMATLSRLMGPPGRSMALSPDGARLAVAGGALPPGTIHVLRMDEGRWAIEDEVRLEEASEPLVPTLALAGDILLVGTPDAGVGGSVHLFRRDPGGWSRVEVFAADSTETGARIGAAVALSASGREAFAAAPGNRRVHRLVVGAGDAWSRAGILTPPDDGVDHGGAFGAALALHGDRLLVGSPRADAGRGTVYAFARDDSGWRLDRTLAPGALDDASFGSAVALRDGLAVVGAPGADGSDGRVGVVRLGGEPGEDELEWLRPGEPLTTVAGSDPVRCVDGEAAGFDCDGVDLVSFLPLSALGAEPGERLTDIWGWTDPETGREYVLAGRTAGLAFVDITDPSVPRLVGLMPANPSSARDIKVYRDHAFLTGDGAGDHGLLVFDLTRLRGIAGAPATFE